jgi:hypothetical protein
MTALRRTDCQGFHRRDFLQLGTAGLLGIGLADLLRLEAEGARAAKAKKADHVIMVWLSGGPATIDMWDLKPDAPEGIRGEFKPIATRAHGVRICEHLPKVAQIMDKSVLVRSLHHNIPAHDVATVYVTTGNRPTPATDFPGLGSLASRLLDAPVGVPAYVRFGNAGEPSNAGYLGSAYNAFQVEAVPERGGFLPGDIVPPGVSLPRGFSLADLNDRDRLVKRFDKHLKALDQADVPASLNKFQQQALDILRSDKTKKAFDLNREKASVRDRYGRGVFGQSALIARRLIEAGARFVTLGIGGWDTHGGNFNTLRGNLLPRLDQTLAALVGDLAERGLLDRTVVYCAGEFNRTPQVNGAAGRDHWASSMAVFLAGGGLKRGFAYGRTDAHGAEPVEDACIPDDVSATIFQCLGFGPHHEVINSAGRPIRIFREGKVLEKALA